VTDCTAAVKGLHNVWERDIKRTVECCSHKAQTNLSFSQRCRAEICHKLRQNNQFVTLMPPLEAVFPSCKKSTICQLRLWYTTRLIITKSNKLYSLYTSWRRYDRFKTAKSWKNNKYLPALSSYVTMLLNIITFLWLWFRCGSIALNFYINLKLYLYLLFY